MSETRNKNYIYSVLTIQFAKFNVHIFSNSPGALHHDWVEKYVTMTVAGFSSRIRATSLLGNYGIFHSLEWLVFLSSIWRVLFPGLPNAYGIQRQSDEISYQGCSSYRTIINLWAAGWPLWVQTVCIYKLIAEIIYPRTNSTVQKHKRNIIRPHQQS